MGKKILITIHDPKDCSLVADAYVIESGVCGANVKNAHVNNAPVVVIPAGYETDRISMKEDYTLHDPPSVCQVMAMHGKACPDATSIMDKGLPPEVQIHFYGDGVLMPDFAAGCRDSERVFFHGHDAEAMKKAKDHDVFFYYSQFDTTAVVLNEALAAGMPVVSVAHEQFARIGTCPWNLWYARPGHLPGVIQKLLGDQAAREELGRTAAKWAPVLSSNEHCVKGYKALYDDLASGRPLYWGRNYSGGQVSTPGTAFGLPPAIFHRYRTAAELTVPPDPWTGRVLDWYDIGGGVGCGQVVVEHARPGVFRYHVLDLCLDHINHGRDAYRQVHYTGGDARKMPYPDGCADVISAFEIIEHVVEGEQLLAECARILRPGGVLWLSTPAKPDDWWEHLRHYPAEELSGMLAAAGFEETTRRWQDCAGVIQSEDTGYVYIVTAKKKAEVN